MAIVTFKDRRTHLTGTITQDGTLYVCIDNDHGPIIVPRKFVSHVTPDKKEAS